MTNKPAITILGRATSMNVQAVLWGLDELGLDFERRDVRQAKRAAPFLEPQPGLVVDQRVEHQAGIGGEVLDDAVEMLHRADHRPEVADHLGLVELRQGRLGDHLERLAGRVREQVEVQAGHVDKRRHKPREGMPDKFGARFHPHCRPVRIVLTNMGTALSTGWGQRGELVLDA